MFAGAGIGRALGVMEDRRHAGHLAMNKVRPLSDAILPKLL